MSTVNTPNWLSFNSDFNAACQSVSFGQSSVCWLSFNSDFNVACQSVSVGLVVLHNLVFAGLVSTLISTLLADQSALDLLYLVYFELALAFVQIAAALKLVHMYFIHIQGSLFAHQISQWCPIPSQLTPADISYAN